MKNYLKYVFILSIAILLSSCEEDLIVFDADNGQTSLSFQATEFSVIVPEEDRVLEIPVNVTTRSSEDRSFEVVVNTEETTPGTAGEYSLGQITIPAGEFSGILAVNFDFSEIGGPDGEVKELVFSIQPPDDSFSYKDTVTVEYFREIICNDMELTIVSDVWATETGFRLERANGEVIVDDFFPFSVNSTQPQTYNVSFFLEDGDYVFTLLDTFGDGQQGSGGGATLTGSYELRCSIIVHASGSGELENGTFESTAFSVNP